MSTFGQQGGSGFGFGQGSAFGAKRSNSFGTSSSGGLFGAQNTSQPAASGSLFGQGNSTPNANSTSGGGVLGTNSSGGLFGSGSQPSGPSVMGQNTSNQPPSGNLFGSANSTQNSGSIFGQNSQQPTGSSIFGTTSSVQPSGGSLFGSSGTGNAQQGSGLFGQKPTTGGLFGQNSQQQSNSLGTSQTGLFGQSSNNQAQAGSLFGNQNGTQQQSSGLFGNNSANSGGGIFGQSSQPPSGSLFGQNNQQSTGTNFGSGSTVQSNGGLFGSQNNQNQQGTGLFGQKPTGGGLFGSQGTNPQNQQTGLLGSANQQSNAAPSLMAPASQAGLGNSTQSGGLFGGGKQQSSLFGNTASNGTTQRLLTSIDQSSYQLPGAQPPQKLYSSLTLPPKARPASETTPVGHALPPPKQNDHPGRVLPSSSGSLALASNPSSGSLNPPVVPIVAREKPLQTATKKERTEPRKWMNSYDDFLSERPTSLVIHRPQRAIGAPASHSMLLTSQGERATLPAPVDPPNKTSSDADLSVFHRPSGMKLVKVNKQALEEGYFVRPPLEQLAAMTNNQLETIHLVVGRIGYGQVEWTSPVDISDIANLGDILGTLVVFEPGTICVYPDPSQKRPQGRGLNSPATVTLEGVWPRDAISKEPITDMADPRMLTHLERLHRACEGPGGDFVTFSHGMWVFRVPHFSKWGLSADEMVVDEPESPVWVPTPPLAQDIEEVNMEDDARPQSWLEQLEHASHTTLAASDKILKGDVEPGLSVLFEPSAYDKAVESLRLPPRGVSRIGWPLRLSNSTKSGVKVETHNYQRQQWGHPLFSKQLPMPSFAKRKVSDLPLAKTPYKLGKSWEIAAVVLQSSNPRKELSDLLEQRLGSNVSRTRALAGDDAFDAVWALVCGHRLREAATRAIGAGLPNLAIQCALLESPCDALVSNSRAQLIEWHQSAVDHHIPNVVHRLTQLAAGELPKILDSANWQQRIAMQLWYTTKPLRDIVKNLKLEDEENSGVEASLVRLALGPESLCSVISKLTLEDAFLLIQALPPGFGVPDSLNDRICYPLALDTLLQDRGDSSGAILVAAHICDDAMALRAMKEILYRVPDAAAGPVSIPPELVAKARALRAHYSGAYIREVQELINSGLTKDAHDILARYVAPRAVVSGTLSDIGDLLGKVSPSLTVFQDYLALKSGNNNTASNLGVTLKSVRTPTLLSRAAVSIMAAAAAETVDVDVALLDPSNRRIEELQQTAALL